MLKNQKCKYFPGDVISNILKKICFSQPLLRFEKIFVPTDLGPMPDIPFSKFYELW